MKTAFLVRTRDKKPFFSVLVSDEGTKFTALTENAKELVSALVDEYEDSPIPKAELAVSLDRGMTIDGPMPQSSLSTAIEKAKMEAEELASQKKNLPTISVSDAPISVFSTSEAKAIISYKASAFVAERHKTTFNYEIKRVRAMWDPTLSIPGTNRRGGWRCPVGTRYGGQITDRFGRNCGWGVARRLANAITNIGERLESVDDRRRGRRVNRRNERMINRLQNAERGAGRLERGLRGIADRLEGDNQNQSTTVPNVPNAPRRPQGQNRQNRRRPQVIESADSGNLRTSERRRMEREIEQPGAPRTGENARRRPAQEEPQAIAPTPRPRRQRRRVASEQQAERTATRRPQNAEPMPDAQPARKPSRRVNNVAEQGALNLGSKWNQQEDGSYERDGFILTLDRNTDGKVTSGTVRAPDGNTYESKFGGEHNERQYREFAEFLYGIAGGEVTKSPNTNNRKFRLPPEFAKGEAGYNPEKLRHMVEDIGLAPDDEAALFEAVNQADRDVDFMENMFQEELASAGVDLGDIARRQLALRKDRDDFHKKLMKARKDLNDRVMQLAEDPNNADILREARTHAVQVLDYNRRYEAARVMEAAAENRLRRGNAPAPQQNENRDVRPLIRNLINFGRDGNGWKQGLGEPDARIFIGLLRDKLDIDENQRLVEYLDAQVRMINNLSGINQAAIQRNFNADNLADLRRRIATNEDQMERTARSLQKHVDELIDRINDPENPAKQVQIRNAAQRVLQSNTNYQVMRNDVASAKLRLLEIERDNATPDVADSSSPRMAPPTPMPSLRKRPAGQADNQPIDVPPAPAAGTPDFAPQIKVDRKPYSPIEMVAVPKEEIAPVKKLVEGMTDEDKRAQAFAFIDGLQGANLRGIQEANQKLQLVLLGALRSINENDTEASAQKKINELLLNDFRFVRTEQYWKDKISQLQGVIRNGNDDNKISALESLEQAYYNLAVAKTLESKKPDLLGNALAAKKRPAFALQTTPQRLGEEMASNITGVISDGITRRKKKVAEYLQQRHGDGALPWENMTPEAFQQLGVQQKLDYIKSIYSHDKIRGDNGKLYSAVVTEATGQHRNFVVRVTFYEIDENGRRLRKVGGSRREIAIGDGEVYNASLSITADSDKNNGIATIYNNYAFMGLQQIGVKKARVTAANDGRFVWAKVGYKRPGQKPPVQNFINEVNFYEKFGPGGLIRDDKEYALLRKLLAKPGVTHQELIFALSGNNKDKVRDEQVKGWFLAHAAIGGGVLSFAKEKVEADPRRLLRNSPKPAVRRRGARARAGNTL